MITHAHKHNTHARARSRTSQVFACLSRSALLPRTRGEPPPLRPPPTVSQPPTGSASARTPERLAVQRLRVCACALGPHSQPFRCCTQPATCRVAAVLRDSCPVCCTSGAVAPRRATRNARRAMRGVQRAAFGVADDGQRRCADWAARRLLRAGRVQGVAPRLRGHRRAAARRAERGSDVRGIARGARALGSRVRACDAAVRARRLQPFVDGPALPTT
jgi:hypothetical protein